MFGMLTHESEDGLGSDLASYLDAFDPLNLIPPEAVRTAGMKIIPPLLGALSDRGLSVFVTHDLNYLMSVYKNSNGRMLLIKANHPDCHPKTGPADTNVMVLARDSELVGCIASRLIWCERSLAEEMESGRFWVADPETMWTEQDRCITTSGAARTIGSCPVVYCGSVYLDPSIRGGMTLAALCRLHLLWLVCHWRWSWLVGIVEAGLLSPARVRRLRRGPGRAGTVDHARRRRAASLPNRAQPARDGDGVVAAARNGRIDAAHGPPAEGDPAARGADHAAAASARAGDCRRRSAAPGMSETMASPCRNV